MKKIEWLATEDLVLKNTKPPLPAKNYMPDWYKSITKFGDNKMQFVNVRSSKERRPNLTVKSCMPFMDSFSTGYILETWCDIHVQKNNDSVEYNWSLGPQIMSNRNSRFSEDFDKNNYFYPHEFEWKLYWVPKLPIGYSMIYTHPFNRIDLPFYTLTGIMDNDSFYKLHKVGNVPFYMTKDFEGIIPAGTPIMQLIPIKREKWNSKKEKINPYKKIYPIKFFQDGYKKLYWHKKEYN